MTIKETVMSPFAKVSGGIAAILAVLNPDVWFVALDALLASGPQRVQRRLCGRADAAAGTPPQTATDWVVVGAGVLFLAYSLRTINQKFDERTMGNTQLQTVQCRIEQ